MSPIRLLTRPLLAGIFITGGLDVLRNPEPRAKVAAPAIEQMAEVAPIFPGDPVQAVRINAAVHVVGGGMLALGILPRLAALALAASLVPTTYGGHRFWAIEDPMQKAQQRTHFFKNAAILGGLLTEALT